MLRPFFSVGFLCFLGALWGGAWGPLNAARPSPNSEKDRYAAFYQLQNQVKNHEAEIGMFESRFQSQEALIESLRNQIDDGLKKTQEYARIQHSQLESKSARQEDINQGMALEIKNYVKDTANIFEEYKNRIVELEKIIHLQSQHIENLKSSLKLFIDAQSKELSSGPLGELKVYVVKSGDSLEKIARAHKTTIKRLKELNSLSGDQIIIGQKLNVPE